MKNVLLQIAQDIYKIICKEKIIDYRLGRYRDCLLYTSYIFFSMPICFSISCYTICSKNFRAHVGLPKQGIVLFNEWLFRRLAPVLYSVITFVTILIFIIIILRDCRFTRNIREHH